MPEPDLTDGLDEKEGMEGDKNLFLYNPNSK